MYVKSDMVMRDLFDNDEPPDSGALSLDNPLGTYFSELCRIHELNEPEYAAMKEVFGFSDEVALERPIGRKRGPVLTAANFENELQRFRRDFRPKDKDDLDV